MGLMIDETRKSLRAKGYNVGKAFVQYEGGTESLRVVVNNEPMSSTQLRMLDEERRTFEEIAAANARRAGLGQVSHDRCS